MNIIWHTVKPPRELLEKTEKELSQWLEESGEKPETLIMHTVIHEDAPMVTVRGIKGDPNFHANYDPTAQWVTLEEAEAGLGGDKASIGIQYDLNDANLPEWLKRLLSQIQEIEDKQKDKDNS